MPSRAWVALIVLIVIPGCLSTGGTIQDSGNAQLTSIGQTPADSGDAVVVTGVVKNYGDGTAENVTVEIELLSESESVATKTLDIGNMDVDQQVEFSTTIYVDPDKVDERRVTVS